MLKCPKEENFLDIKKDGEINIKLKFTIKLSLINFISGEKIDF